MSNGHAIIVAIEEYHYPKMLHKVAFAINDANGIKDARPLLFTTLLGKPHYKFHDELFTSCN